MLAQQQRKQHREEKILSSLDDLVFATRDQLQVINNLGGDRNAQRILQRMEQDNLIKSLRYERKIYRLSSRGRHQIGSTQDEPKTSWITHTIMRNDLYIKLDMPGDWRKEVPVKWGDNKLIPDATFKRSSEFYFVEIDNQQSMRTNIEKIKKYKDLSRVIFGQYNHTPTLIWYTVSPVRQKKLKETCETLGVKHIVYCSMN